ncbi:hypothetical protein RB195_008124 [Necator americanus]|uniref:Uncharacterized protein n=1 Tax=Necator americanus TaxID=51031 RepID=A0ABR1CM44_NECAM
MYAHLTNHVLPRKISEISFEDVVKTHKELLELNITSAVAAFYSPQRDCVFNSLRENEISDRFIRYDDTNRRTSPAGSTASLGVNIGVRHPAPKELFLFNFGLHAQEDGSYERDILRKCAKVNSAINSL